MAFAVLLAGSGLAFLPPLVLHAQGAYDRTLRGGPSAPWVKALVWASYSPLVYFLPVVLPKLVRGASLDFLWPGSRLGRYYGVWLGSALISGVFFQRRFLEQAADGLQRRFYQALLYFFAVAGLLVMLTYTLAGSPPGPIFTAMGTAVLLGSLFPSSLFGYFVLRHNFLQIGVQRNLVYAVSAAFLALLYLSLVRRVGTWLEPVLPPEATAAILLFTLVVFFEPLQRRVGRALRRGFRLQMDGLQRLSAEFQHEARQGELERLVSLIEQRIRDEFGLANVRLWLREGPPRPAVSSGRVHRFTLRKEGREAGRLEAYFYGAFLSGETQAALEFLAEQLPATMDLCRLIEEKLKLERELAERERLALVGQMAASISHNLKNPLSSMKTLLQVQLENPALPQTTREDCELVLEEIDRLSAKLGQLLRYAKPSVRAGGTPQRVAVLGLAEQLVALLGREAARRQVRLALEAETGETFVRGSEEALGDVLSNLVVNAIEAVSPGGSVRIRVARRNSAVVVEVTDDGPGIPAELRGKIFQPFFTTKPSGTGLGLAIVERRVGELNGTIEWSSPVRDGRGTRFTVSLPVEGSSGR